MFIFYQQGRSSNFYNSQFNARGRHMFLNQTIVFHHNLSDLPGNMLFIKIWKGLPNELQGFAQILLFFLRKFHFIIWDWTWTFHIVHYAIVEIHSSQISFDNTIISGTLMESRIYHAGFTGWKNTSPNSTLYKLHASANSLSHERISIYIPIYVYKIGDLGLPMSY